MLPTRMVGVRLDDLVEKLYFVDGGFGIVSGGSDDLEGDVLAVGVVSGEPDGGEVTPAQFANDGIFSILVVLANGDRMVATLAVILGILLVGSVVGGVVN